MDIALVGARLVLAATFALAAFAKLGDQDGSRKAVAAFGVPGRLVSPVAGILPFAELAVAVALVPGLSGWYGALAALALLAAFSAAIAVNLARGRRPECRCFGQIGSGPIGASTLLRNGLLGALAIFVAVRGPTQPALDPGSLLAGLSPVELVTLSIATLALLGTVAVFWLLFETLRQQGRMLLQLESIEGRLNAGLGAASLPSNPVTDNAAAAAPLGMTASRPAPTFTLPGLAGEMYSLDALCAAEVPVLLLFVDPHCGPCASLLPDVATWQREQADRLTVAIISRGSVADNRAKVSGLGLTTVLLQKDFEVADSFGVTGTPSAVIVRADGTIGSEVRPGPDPIRALVSEILGAGVPSPIVNGGHGHAHAGHDHGGHDHSGHDHAHAGHDHAGHAGHQHAGHGQAVAAPLRGLGDQAPEIRLTDLDGEPRSLTAMRGDKTLVLFWNPGCGFCQQMLPELQAWEASRSASDPRLFVISDGSIEANRQLNLRSPIVLDPTFSTGAAFGATGTPSGVLIDAKGRVASSVAAGAPAVFALIRGPGPQA